MKLVARQVVHDSSVAAKICRGSADGIEHKSDLKFVIKQAIMGFLNICPGKENAVIGVGVIPANQGFPQLPSERSHAFHVTPREGKMCWIRLGRHNGYGVFNIEMPTLTGDVPADLPH